MPELWILCMALDPLKLYPHMKFHFNSISWTWIIAFGQKKCDGTKVWRDKKCDVGQKCDVRTDGRTDGQKDGGKVIPKCHLCLQQVTQKIKKLNERTNERTNARTNRRTDGRTVRFYYAPNFILKILGFGFLVNVDHKQHPQTSLTLQPPVFGSHYHFSKILTLLYLFPTYDLFHNIERHKCIWAYMRCYHSPTHQSVNKEKQLISVLNLSELKK